MNKMNNFRMNRTMEVRRSILKKLYDCLKINLNKVKSLVNANLKNVILYLMFHQYT